MAGIPRRHFLNKAGRAGLAFALNPWFVRAAPASSPSTTIPYVNANGVNAGQGGR